MLSDLKTIGKLVEDILRSDPRSRDDDTYLLLRVWQRQGFKIPDELLQSIVNYATKPEAVSRVRRKIQEDGRYQGTMRQQRLFEEENVREWAR